MKDALIGLLLIIVASSLLAFITIKSKWFTYTFVFLIVMAIVAFMFWSEEDFKPNAPKEPNQEILNAVKEKYANKSEGER